jgi:hypothetical protein
LYPSEGVDILIRHPTGEQKTLVLPPTEAVRKPVSETEDLVEKPVKPKGLAGAVAGKVPVYDYLTLDDGTYIKLESGSPDDFAVGKTYVFHEVAPRFPFSKQVRRVVWEGEQGDLLP